MALTWTDDLATGSPEIDNQHRMILDRINAMMDACSLGKGKQEIRSILPFLEEYVVTHFDAEERLMKSRGYAGYRAHKAEHLEFIKKVVSLKRRVSAEGVGLDTVIETNQMAMSWFMNHIRRVDTQLSPFSNTKVQPQG